MTREGFERALEAELHSDPIEPIKKKSNGLSASAVTGPAVASAGWKTKLILNDNGTPKAVLANAITALRSAPQFDGVLGFNEFTSNVVTLKPLPWRDGVVCNEWTDHEDRLIADWLQHSGIYVRVDIAAQAVLVVARDRPFHPVREYLDGLEWDGTRRIDTWLTTYLGVDGAQSSEGDEEEEVQKGRADYVAAVGSRWLISAVARIYKPGEKVDYCLILEGPQGIGKSRSLRVLGGPWFTDEIADLGSKDAAMQTRGIWIIEIAELESMTRSEVGRIKDFMSRSVDRFRPPYGKHLILSPRQCVFAGSVNHSTYLKDETGGRRFWPVTCKRVRLAELERDRDQLWAEAVACYRNGAVWWPDSPELNRLAEEEQNDRYVEDAWHSRITEFVATRDDVSVAEVLEQCIRKPFEQLTQPDQNRVVKSLTKLGWKQRRRGPRNAPRQRRYYAPQLTLGI
jgi:predicted P-loop ATPase